MQRRHFLQLSALAGLAAALPRLGLGLGASVDLSGVLSLIHI